MINFKEATDVLTFAPTMTLAKVAEAFGKDTHTIMRARMEGPNARTPPRDWQPVVAQLAREQADALVEYARDLIAMADTLVEKSAAGTRSPGTRQHL
ncbi:MAG TPA: hypothetical protein VGC13_23650 [Longimicrobium sp.]|jgi:hypothetical protein|uniref:hypothetical protein n=1 Tax=Longimicrobium sp. TaxID=2029185 RepID=UPI002ED7AFEC